MSSLRVLLVCCAVGVWLNACGAPADPEVAVAQLVFATYGAGAGVTVAYLAPVLAEQPAFATKRIWRGAGGRLAELPLASKSGPGPASARYTFRIVTQTAQRMTVEVSDNYEGGGGVTEQWELEQGVAAGRSGSASRSCCGSRWSHRRCGQTPADGQAFGIWRIGSGGADGSGGI